MSKDTLGPVGDPMADPAAETCERCKGPAKLVATVPALEKKPGHMIFRCEPCRHNTWTVLPKWADTPVFGNTAPKFP